MACILNAERSGLDFLFCCGNPDGDCIQRLP